MHFPWPTWLISRHGTSSCASTCALAASCRASRASRASASRRAKTPCTALGRWAAGRSPRSTGDRFDRGKWWKSVEIPWNPMRFVSCFWVENPTIEFWWAIEKPAVLIGKSARDRNQMYSRGGTIFNMLWNLGLTMPDRSHTEGRTSEAQDERVQLQGLCARNMADIGPPQLWIWDAIAPMTASDWIIGWQGVKACRCLLQMGDHRKAGNDGTVSFHWEIPRPSRYQPPWVQKPRRRPCTDNPGFLIAAVTGDKGCFGWAKTEKLLFSGW